MIFRTIMIDIIQTLQNYGLYSLICSLLLILVVFSIMYFLWKGPTLEWMRREWKRLLGLYLFCVYGFMVLSITILSRPEGSRVGVNLKLFTTLSNRLEGMVFPLENVLLFIPLGIMLPLIWHHFQHLDYTLEVGLTFSILIEIVQYITKRGYLQTDDILTNVIGVFIGYIIYRIIRPIK